MISKTFNCVQSIIIVLFGNIREHLDISEKGTKILTDILIQKGFNESAFDQVITQFFLERRFVLLSTVQNYTRATLNRQTYVFFYFVCWPDWTSGPNRLTRSTSLDYNTFTSANARAMLCSVGRHEVGLADGASARGVHGTCSPVLWCFFSTRWQSRGIRVRTGYGAQYYHHYKYRI